MRRRHLRSVMAIERRVYTRPWSPALFLAEMADPANRCYLVARLEGEVVGYGGAIVYDGEAHVTNVAVAPEHQRRGIAARLLHDLIAGSIELGAESVALEVRVTNWAAQRLYARFGFRPVGIRRNYYQDVGEDALIMWVDDVRTDGFRARLRREADRMPEAVRP
ncbi:MAG: ribosomal protein S18-alanine N-acetyltransferase [Actinomycetota bacterium]